MSKWSNVKRGWLTVNGQRIYFDSRGEINYFLYLDWLKKRGEIKDFVYHPPYFDFSKWVKHGLTRYEVDFKIIELDGREWYVEIKSTTRLDKMDGNSRTKIKRLRKYYDHIQLHVVSTYDVQKLNLCGIISDWEW